MNQQPRPVALIAGTGSGIGRAIAVALAGAGFDAAINYSCSEPASARGAAESDKGIILSRDTPETPYKKAKDVNTLGLCPLSFGDATEWGPAAHNYKTQRLAMFSEVTRR